MLITFLLDMFDVSSIITVVLVIYLVVLYRKASLKANTKDERWSANIVDTNPVLYADEIADELFIRTRTHFSLSS